MKKRIVFGLCLLASCTALWGCSGTNNSSQTDTTVPAAGTDSDGTVSQNQSGTSEGTLSPETETTPTVLPTPTPEGSYVAFSVESGFYEDSVKLDLSCNVEGAKIYYTLDGSTPDETSTLYESTIRITRNYSENILSAQKNTSASNTYLPKKPVTKATVVRAVAYLPDGTVTPVCHGSYFVGIDRESQYGDVPVISLITDFDHLYDYETGIYVLGKTHADWLTEDPSHAFLEGWQQLANYSNSGKEWERPISVEYISPDGTPGFKLNMGVRIMGGASRNQTQKSLKLIAREEYGAKALEFELIPDNLRSDGAGVLTRYKSFVLRNGGNDADFGRVRDPLLQALAENCRFETQQATPCIVYLNGEYWGLYSITEDYSDNYFENNYGVDNKNVVLVKCGEIEDGEDEDITLFQDMYNFIVTNDMSRPELYAAACDLVDIGSFIDYFAFELYVANEDSIFENNNWRMWRVREADHATAVADGKWRMAAYDTDYSTGIYSGAASAGTDNITARITASSSEERQANIEHYVPLELFRSLLNNDQFREELIVALCDMRNIHFEASRANAALDAMAETYLPLMPDTFKRFGPDWIVNQNTREYFSGKLDDLGKYLTKRYVSMPTILRQAFGLGQTVKLTVSSSDPALGTVRLNQSILDLTSSYNGVYFPDLGLTLTAIPAEGCRFAGWETDSGILTDPSAASIHFELEKNTSITAVFETN
ncbi:MAG: CotH kinase family protein [Lachnospiraceae bacterium]|nr:CotH kinase family protein [Lachnospiraceae bacterium]